MTRFVRVLEQDPKNVQAQLSLADVYEVAGQTGRAKSVYTDLRDAHPDNPMILFRYADFLERQGHNRQAERLRDEARGELPGVERRKMRKLKSRKKRKKRRRK